MIIHSKHYFIARPWKNIERGKLSADTEINIITMTEYIIIIKDNLFTYYTCITHTSKICLKSCIHSLRGNVPLKSETTPNYLG